MRTLPPAERRQLRAKAHHLHPFVSVGQHGLTPAVLHEIDINLLAHELIKIRVFVDDRRERETLLGRICEELDAAPVQHLGKILTVWRPAPQPVAEPVAPRADRRNRARTPKAAEKATGPTTAGRRKASATRVRRAPRRGPSVIQSERTAKPPPRGAAPVPGKKPATRRPPRPHGKSASSSVGASGGRRRRKAH